jgi:uncharacterized protein YndB with AHSA1/START domain
MTMPLQLCPTASVAAPVERVWALLADPRRYGEWWDARTERITPEGPAVAGQEIAASSRALGRRWPVHITVESVDAAHHRIELLTRFPFGLTIRNTITSTPVSEETSWLQFG